MLSADVWVFRVSRVRVKWHSNWLPIPIPSGLPLVMKYHIIAALLIVLIFTQHYHTLR